MPFLDEFLALKPSSPEMDEFFGRKPGGPLVTQKPEAEAEPPLDLDQRGFLREAASSLSAGVVSTMESVSGTLEMLGVPGAETAVGYWEELGQAAPLQRPRYLQEGTILDHPERLGDWRWWTRSLGENLPNMAAMMLPGLGAMKAAKAAGWGQRAIRAAASTGAFSGAAAIEGGAQYLQAKREMEREGGWDPVEIERVATAEGITTATVNGILEVLPFDRLFLRSWGGDKIVKRFVRQAMLEGSTEVAQEGVSMLVAHMGHEPDLELKDAIGQALEAGLIGAALGGGAGVFLGGGEGVEAKDRAKPGADAPMTSSATASTEAAEAPIREREQAEKDEQKRQLEARDRAAGMLESIVAEEEQARTQAEEIRRQQQEQEAGTPDPLLQEAAGRGAAVIADPALEARQKQIADDLGTPQEEIEAAPGAEPPPAAGVADPQVREAIHRQILELGSVQAVDSFYGGENEAKGKPLSLVDQYARDAARHLLGEETPTPTTPTEPGPAPEEVSPSAAAEPPVEPDDLPGAGAAAGQPPSGGLTTPPEGPSKAGPQKPNKHGVYAKAERVQVKIPKAARHTAEVRVAQGEDGKWRIGVSQSRDYGQGAGGSRLPRAADPGFGSREEAVLAGLQEIRQDFLRERDQGDTMVKPELHERRSRKALEAVEKAIEAHGGTVEAAGKKPQEKAKEHIHDYSSTQVRMPEAVAQKARAYAARIPEEELYTEPEDASYGRAEEPHVTVRYGLGTDNPAEVAKAFEGMGPIEVTLGKVSIFETDKNDVVKAEAEGEGLREANRRVGEAVDLPGETYKDYKPHMTLAYVKKGEGAKYAGDTEFEGETATIDAIELADRQGKVHRIELTGERAPRKAKAKDVAGRKKKQAKEEPPATGNEKTWFDLGSKVNDAMPHETGLKPTSEDYKVAAKKLEISTVDAQRAWQAYTWGVDSLELPDKPAPAPSDLQPEPAGRKENVTGRKKQAKEGEYPTAGDTVGGRKVRDEVPNQPSIEASVSEPEILPGIREVPMSDFELTGKHYSKEGNERIAELAEEIRASGEIAPLIVVVEPEGPYILEGATRADALYRLGAKSFPAMVVKENAPVEEADVAGRKKKTPLYEPGAPQLKARTQNPPTAAEREALVGIQFDGKEPAEAYGERQLVLLSGGNSGAGKTKTETLIDKDKTVLANADIIKHQAHWDQGDDAVAFHPASSGLVREVMDRGIEAGYHTFYDNRLHDLQLTLDTIEKALASGAEVLVDFTQVDLATSRIRTLLRMLAGGDTRYVPDSIILKGENRCLFTFLELWKRYQDNPDVRFFLTDNSKDRLKGTDPGPVEVIRDSEVVDQEMLDTYNSISYTVHADKKGRSYCERDDKATVETLREAEAEVNQRLRRITDSWYEKGIKGAEWRGAYEGGQDGTPEGLSALVEAFAPLPKAEPKTEPTESREGAAPSAPVVSGEPAGYGATNTVFTQEAAEQARELLRKKLGQLNTGLDPEMVQAGIQLAGYHIEAGARSFAAYVKAMAADLGDAVRPYLRGWYEAVRHYPGFDAAGMTDPAEIAEGAAEAAEETKEAPSGEADAGAVEEGEAGGPGGAGRLDVSGVPGSPEVPPGESPGAGEGALPGGPGAARPDVPEGGAAGDVAPEDAGARGEPGSGPDRGARAEPGEPAGRPGLEPEPTPGAPGGGAPAHPGVGAKPALAPEDQNHRIQPDDELAPAGVEGKIQANIKALRLLRTLQKANRNPSPEEKPVLARFVGWGAFSERVFSHEFDRYVREYRDRYAPEEWFHDEKKLKKYRDWEKKYGKALHPALGGLMSDDDWSRAAESTLNAHYTSKEVIGAVWDLIGRLGFAGGAVLEPAAGVGHFLGLAPESLARRSRFEAVELDSVTGEILAKLYPQARVQVTGFESARGVPDNSMDLVVSNFPFGKFSVYDKAHPEYRKWSIHNYFFGRSLDAVKPGGLVVGITSHWTLDAKTGGPIREALGKKADLVGAIRLPNTAFSKNAGTEVVTDILVFRKKAEDQVGLGEDFRHVQGVEISKKKSADVNEYFARHPEMVLGEHSLQGSMRGGEDEYTVTARKGEDLAQALAGAVGQFPENVASQVQAPRRSSEDVRYAEAGQRDGTLVEDDGGLFMVEEGRLVKPWVLDSKGQRQKLAPAREKRARSYLDLREKAKALIARSQAEDASDAEVETLRAALDTAYDRFVKKYKRFGDPPNAFLRQLDSEFPIVDALEIESVVPEEVEIQSGPRKGRKRLVNTKQYEKAPILTRRTLWPWKEPETAETLEDAVKISRVYRGGLDPEYMARILGRDREALERELLEDGQAYLNPKNGRMEPPDLYLSGNVRKKLRQAEAAAEEDERYRANVKALEAVQPEPLDLEFISFRLGTPWVPEAAVQDFLKEEFGVTGRVREIRTRETVSWAVKAHGGTRDTLNMETWGVPGKPGHELLQDALNLKRSEIYNYWRDENGNPRREINQDATIAAQSKQAEIQARFQGWARAHDTWGQELADRYNEAYNGHRLREFEVPDVDNFPGANPDFKLRETSKKAIVRCLQEPTLLAYGVGTGKTFIYVHLAMEMRRLSTAKKPLIVVHNATVSQYRKAFAETFPQAKVLIPNDNQRSARYRQRLLSQIATGDWDAVVLPQSFFDGIADDPERQAAFIQEQLDMIAEAVGEAKGEEGEKSPRVKELKALQKRKREQLARLLDRRVDDALTWEQMGVDALLIDEAHSYKRSEFFTKMTRIKGIDSGASQRSTSLMLKADYVRSKTGGKNVVLATGTPISNTTAELWTMMRYLRPDLLEEYRVELFDDFAATFGETSVTLEETQPGVWRNVERFNKYVNGPELLTLFHTVSDVLLTNKANLKLPDVKGGGPQEVRIEPHEELAQYIDAIRRAREAWERLSGREKMEQRHVPLMLYTAARKAAVDLRLVDPAYEDHPGSKLNQVVERVHEVWQRTEAESSAQAVFLDLRRSSGGGFDAHQEIKQKLVALGVPAAEIGVVEEAGSDAKREALFQRVRDGECRVVIGSTEKLGIGVNMQDRLIAAHHVDVPHRPMDIEQRNGRIVREKNGNAEVEIYNYGVTKTLDSVSYDRLVKKQRFIDQMLIGEIEGRSFDEPNSEDQLSFAEMQAAFAGDPLVFERVELDQKVKELRVLRTAYEGRVSRARRDLRAWRQEWMPALERGLEKERRFKEVLAGAFPEGRVEAVQVGEQTLDRKAFGKEVVPAWEAARKELEETFDQIPYQDYERLVSEGQHTRVFRLGVGPFDLRVTFEADVDFAWAEVTKKPTARLDLRGVRARLEVRHEGEAIEADIRAQTPAGFLRAFDAWIEREKQAPELTEARLKRARKEVDELEKVAEETFTQAGELAETERRLVEVNQELEQKARQGQPGEGEAVDPEALARGIPGPGEASPAAPARDTAGRKKRTKKDPPDPRTHFGELAKEEPQVKPVVTKFLGNTDSRVTVPGGVASGHWMLFDDFVPPGVRKRFDNPPEGTQRFEVEDISAQMPKEAPAGRYLFTYAPEDSEKPTIAVFETGTGALAGFNEEYVSYLQRHIKDFSLHVSAPVEPAGVYSGDTLAGVLMPMDLTKGPYADQFEALEKARQARKEGREPEPVEGETRLRFGAEPELPYLLSPRQFRNTRKIAQQVREWLQEAGANPEVLERIQVDLQPILGAYGENVERSLDEWARELEDGEPRVVLGSTTVNRMQALVQLALNVQDLKGLERTSYHEFFHVAMRWLLPERDVNRILRHYKTEERAAEAFADFVLRHKGARTASGPTTLVDAVFRKLRRILQIIRNGLNGLGFHRPEDVFGRVILGQYRAHFATGEGPTQVSFAFGGKGAKTADKSALNKAVEMEQAGKDTEAIRKKTGWFLGMDDRWRFEISDDELTIDAKVLTRKQTMENLRMGDIAEHPRLYKAYPHARDIIIHIRPDRKYAGAYLGGNKIQLTTDANPKERRNTLIHEIQHWIQEQEGFARGGDVGSVIEKARLSFKKADLAEHLFYVYYGTAGYPEGNPLHNMTKDERAQFFANRDVENGRLTEEEAQDVLDFVKSLPQNKNRAKAAIKKAATERMVKRKERPFLAGEIESRDVAARDAIPPEKRREIPPYQTQGIPKEDAIVYFGTGPSGASFAFAGQPLGPNETMLRLQEQPRGAEVARDVEQNRSFVNKLFEMRDLAKLRVQVAVNRLQKEVQALAGPESRRKFTLGFAYDRRLKHSSASAQLDRALLIHRDLQAAPEKAAEYRAWAAERLQAEDLKPREKLTIKGNLRVLDLAEGLTDEQKALADRVGGLFDDAFQVASNAKLVQTHRDHYVRRVWQVPEGLEGRFQASGTGHGFKVGFEPGKHRVFDTVLDGWMNGYELSVQGLTNAYERYMSELSTVLANKAFLQRGVNTRNVDGGELFSTRRLEGYEKLEASGFRVWRWAGSVKAELELPEQEAMVVDGFGRRFWAAPPERLPERWAVYKNPTTTHPSKVFETEAEALAYAQEKNYERIERKPAEDVSNLFEQQDLYAPKPLAEMINKMTAKDTIFRKTPGAEVLLRLNAGLKAWILMSSFFHHLAGARSWVFGVHHGWKGKKWNPVAAYKAGLKKIEDLHPLVELGVKNGLTTGELQDWSEHELRSREGLTERLVKHFGWEKAAQTIEKGKFHRETWADALFKRFFAGLKVEAFVLEYTHELQKAQDAWEAGRRAHPPNPDRIAERVARLINADFGGLHVQRMGRNPTLQKVARLLLLAPDWTESNFRTVTGLIPGLNDWIGKVIGDVPGPRGMEKIYRKFWGRVMLRIAVSTIIAQMLLNSADESDEFYKEQLLGGQFKKGRWLEVDITKIYHALGVDTEGQRKTFSLGGHFFHPLKLLAPMRLAKGKGSPVTKVFGALSTGTDWADRPFTGVKELVSEGKTIKGSAYEPVEGEFNRLPSVVVNQVVSMQPIQVGHFLRYLAGEQDGLSALLLSMGAYVHTAWKPRVVTPIKDTGEAPGAFREVARLHEAGHLTMGPPSKHFTINGVSHELTREQYDRYLTESSDKAAARLAKSTAGARWARFTPEQKAEIVAKVVKASRRRVRQKLKREILREKRRATNA